MIRIDALVREGRDAVIAERLLGTGPARRPYSLNTKRGFFWQRGADLARSAIDNLMNIGA